LSLLEQEFDLIVVCRLLLRDTDMVVEYNPGTHNGMCIALPVIRPSNEHCELVLEGQSDICRETDE
jgi:hypothetical protein